MRKRVHLESVTVGELGRNPSAVLRRVRNGERLVVCSHRRPIATIQPLNGYVVQPFEGAEYDIAGSPLGDAAAEAAKLDDIQRDMLVRGQRLDRFLPIRVSDRWDFSSVMRRLEDMALRGLVHKTERGWRLTGRGWLLRETLTPGENQLAKTSSRAADGGEGST